MSKIKKEDLIAENKRAELERKKQELLRLLRAEDNRRWVREKLEEKKWGK